MAPHVALKRRSHLARNRSKWCKARTLPPLADCLSVMAKAASRAKKVAAKSKPSMPARAKAAPPAAARKALKKSPAKPVSKSAGKVIASKPATEVAKSGKWVFTFGDGKAEGKAELRNLLGGKGANLAEMANLGLPVPPGFTIPTSAC